MSNRIESPDGELSKLAARRAVEALRNGVPNREAVRQLGCSQPHTEAQFLKLLNEAADEGVPPHGGLGMLISGDFGSGKSHLLTHMENLALSQNFICSRIAISKETPLYDLGKTFDAAIANARIPDRAGRLIEEIAPILNPESESYCKFFQWTEDAAKQGLVSQIFPASLFVYCRIGDEELRNDIESFWAGGKIRVGQIKSGLRALGEASKYSFRAPRLAELPPQRLRFVTELIRGVGYRGWVVLIDEIELVGSYAVLQRGRSYAEVARWMGRSQGDDYPGLVAVGAVTEDFAAAIIGPDGKNDRELVRPRLEGSARYGELGPRAETGMRLLEHECRRLEPLGDDEVAAAIEALGRIYTRAYNWNPGMYEASAGGAGFLRHMRYKVRAAINEWDLRRLIPEYLPEMEVEDFTPTYREDSDLERESWDDH